MVQRETTREKRLHYTWLKPSKKKSRELSKRRVIVKFFTSVTCKFQGSETCWSVSVKTMKSLGLYQRKYWNTDIIFYSYKVITTEKGQIFFQEVGIGFGVSRYSLNSKYSFFFQYLQIVLQCYNSEFFFKMLSIKFDPCPRRVAE